MVCRLYEDNDAFELKTISKEEFDKATDNAFMREVFCDANRK